MDKGVVALKTGMPGGWVRNWRGLPQEVAIGQSRLFRAALVFKAAGLAAAVNVVCSVYPDFAVVHA
jgi:hypothetical protein